MWKIQGANTELKLFQRSYKVMHSSSPLCERISKVWCCSCHLQPSAKIMNFITQPFTSDLWQKGIDMFSHNILSKFISTDILYKDFI